MNIAKKSAAALAAALAAGALQAQFAVDRSVMSKAYWDIWNDAAQAKIDADIEKYRKGDGAVEGVPAGTEVMVEQLTHAFYFGAHIFNFNQLGKTEWNNRYKELYGTLFNSATVALYWRTMEPYPEAVRFEERYEDTEAFWNNCPHPKEQPHWRRPAPDPVIDFLNGRGVRVHGHTLVWGNGQWNMPTWIWDDFCPEEEKLALEQAAGVKFPRRDFRIPAGVKDEPRCYEWPAAWEKVYRKLTPRQVAELVPSFVKAQKELTERRIMEIGARYGSRVQSWDVVNEPATDWAINAKKSWPVGETAAKNSDPVTFSYYGLMPANYAYETLKVARKALGPKAVMALNEGYMIPFAKQIADLAGHGADFDMVGSLYHLFDPAESLNIARGEGPVDFRPDKVAETYAMVSAAAGDRPIHFSELTITAPDNSPRGQMIQAIIVRNMYRAWFAVEKMNGITWWNVVDDCGAPGEPSISGIFTRDMRPKAAYHMLNDLIHREWKTKATMKADASGKASFRGFKGRYLATWKDASGKIQTRIVTVK